MSRRIASAVASAVAWAAASAIAAIAWPVSSDAAAGDDFQRGLLAYQRGDVVAAMSALKPAADAGLADAQQLLAFILDRADFVDEAIRLYQQAAAQDQPEAIAALGNLAAAGRGLAKDENAALRHFSKAASLGHPASLELVADAWLNRRWGLDFIKEPDLALIAVRRAADLGHLPSIDALAQAHLEGRLGLAVDSAESARWRERAEGLRRLRAGVSASGAAR